MKIFVIFRVNWSKRKFTNNLITFGTIYPTNRGGEWEARAKVAIHVTEVCTCYHVSFSMGILNKGISHVWEEASKAKVGPTSKNSIN